MHRYGNTALLVDSYKEETHVISFEARHRFYRLAFCDEINDEDGDGGEEDGDGEEGVGGCEGSSDRRVR